MKSLLCLIILALSGCATPPQRTAADGMRASPPTPGTVAITGNDLKQTGRTELPDALRASSPIFH